LHLGDPVVLGLDPGELAGDLLGALDVVPQVRRGRLGLELGDLGLEPVDVADITDRLHGRPDCLDLTVEVHCHKETDYARASTRRCAASSAGPLRRTGRCAAGRPGPWRAATRRPRAR